MKKHIIWSNMNLGDPEEWDFEDKDEMTEEEIQERIYELNSSYLDDERINLKKIINPILIIADLGLWNGRRQGYKIIESGNISDILWDIFYADADYAEWYSDGKDIRGTIIHHDGTNNYLYREIKDRDKVGTLLDKIYAGEDIDRRTLSRYTKSIHPYVQEVYGWTK